MHRLRYLRGGRLLRRQYPTKARHSSRMTMVAISALPSPAIIKIIWSIEIIAAVSMFLSIKVNNCSEVLFGRL